MKQLRRFGLCLLLLCLFLTACGKDTGSRDNAKGLDLFGKGNMEEALEAFEAAISADDTCSEYYLNKAYTLLELSRPGEALSCAESVLSGESPEAKSLLCAGTCALKAEEVEKAVTYLEKARSLAGEEKELKRNSCLYLAEAYEAAAAPDKAADCYRALLEEEDHPEYEYLLGKCFLKCEKLREAMDCFSRFAEGAEGSAERYVDIYKLLSDAGEEGEAVQYLEYAKALSPKSAKEKKLHGMVQYLLGNYEEAASELSQISEKEKDVNVYIYLGLSYKELGDEAEAEKVLEQALSASEEPAAVYYQLALLDMEQSDHESALSQLEAAIALGDEENMARLLYAKGACLEYTQRYGEALEVFKALREAYGSDETLDHEIAWLETR